MPRRRKTKPPVDTQPRTEVGGTHLIGEQMINYQQLQLQTSKKNH